MSIKCPYCGFENPDTSSFCGNCAQNTLDGYNTKDAKIQRIQKNHKLSEAQKTQLSGCLIILGVMFAVGIFLYVSTFQIKQKSTDIEETEMEITEKSISVKKYGLPTVDYVYSVGMTKDPDTGKVDLNVYTKNKRFKFQEDNGVLRSKSVFVNFDIFAGITDNREVFIVNKDYVNIGNQKYEYEESLRNLISISEVLTVAVDDLYIWFFTGELTVISAKRNEKQMKLKLEMINPITPFSTVYGAYYLSQNRVMYLSNGQSFYRLEFGKRDTFKYKEMKELNFNNKEEAVIALATYGNSFVYVTRNYSDKSQNLYVTTVEEMESLFR